jgi:hypothetical protein
MLKVPITCLDPVRLNAKGPVPSLKCGTNSRAWHSVLSGQYGSRELLETHGRISNMKTRSQHAGV